MSPPPPLDPAAVAALLASYSLDSTLGVLFIGNIFIAILFTLTSIQIITYYRRNKEDRPVIKHLIFVLWILDAVHFAFVTHTVYNYAVTNYLNPFALFQVNWSLAADMTVGGLSDLIVTMLLVQRIWRFGGHHFAVKVIVGVIMLGSIFIIGGDVAINILALRGTATYTAFQQNYSWLWKATFAVRAGVDVTIASSIYFMLHKARSEETRTNSVIRLIIIYSINTCALTTIVVILCIVVYAAFPKSFATFAVAMLLPKLMLNSLLAILNSRKTLREKYYVNSRSIHLSPIGGHSSQQPFSRASLPGPVLAVKVNTTTDRTYDDAYPKLGDDESHAV